VGWPDPRVREPGGWVDVSLLRRDARNSATNDVPMRGRYYMTSNRLAEYYIIPR